MPNNSDNRKKKTAIELEQMIRDLNDQVSDLAGKLAEDLNVARRIQKSVIPEKFPSVPGFNVRHKYLSGLKSGGDYIDFFEFDDKTHIGVIMSDSSGYGLSASFLSIMLKLSMKLSKDEAKSPGKTLQKIFEELKVTMKPKEELSIFYGIINRKTFKMRYTGFGNIHFVIHANKTEDQKEDVQVTDVSINPGQLKSVSDVQFTDSEVMLHPGERLTFMSDGFFEAFDGGDFLIQAVKNYYHDDPMSFVNECTYQIKRAFSEEGDMPNQDCSVMVIDIEKRAMRLASAV